jgi:hypothetical protein
LFRIWGEFFSSFQVSPHPFTRFRGVSRPAAVPLIKSS